MALFIVETWLRCWMMGLEVGLAVLPALAAWFMSRAVVPRATYFSAVKYNARGDRLLCRWWLAVQCCCPLRGL
jgi:hypothetical protein